MDKLRLLLSIGGGIIAWLLYQVFILNKRIKVLEHNSNTLMKILIHLQNGGEIKIEKGDEY